MSCDIINIFLCHRVAPSCPLLAVTGINEDEIMIKRTRRLITFSGRRVFGQTVRVAESMAPHNIIEQNLIIGIN